MTKSLNATDGESQAEDSQPRPTAKVPARRDRNSWLSTTWKSIVGAGLLGIIVTVGIEIWRANVESPQLTVVVDAVERLIAPETRVSLDQSEFEFLKQFRPRKSSFAWIAQPVVDDDEGELPGDVPLKRVAALIRRAEYELQTQPNIVKAREDEFRQVAVLDPATFTVQKGEELNATLDVDVDLVLLLAAETAESTRLVASKIVDEFRTAYAKRAEAAKQREKELREKLRPAKEKFNELTEVLQRTRSLFSVAASVTNTGKQNVALKEAALMRVYIGTGNYVDIRLLLANYRDSATVTDYSTQVVRFESGAISEMQEQDTSLINAYWGQTVPAILFVEDSLGVVHASNPIEFSPGLHRKRAFDKLSKAAAEYPDSRVH